MTFTLTTAHATLMALRDYLKSQGLLAASNAVFLDRIIDGVRKRIALTGGQP